MSYTFCISVNFISKYFIFWMLFWMQFIFQLFAASIQILQNNDYPVTLLNSLPVLVVVF